MATPTVPDIGELIKSNPSILSDYISNNPEVLVPIAQSIAQNPVTQERLKAMANTDWVDPLLQATVLNPAVQERLKTLQDMSWVQPILDSILKNQQFQDLLKKMTDLTWIHPLLDTITETPPVNFPDTALFSFGGTEFTPFFLAGLILPLFFIVILLLIMRNCYGYGLMMLWGAIILMWLGLNIFLFKQTYDFQKQINMVSKYVLILVSILFVVLTAVGIAIGVVVGRIISTFGFVFSFLSPSATPVAAAPAVAAPAIAAPAVAPAATPAATPVVANAVPDKLAYTPYYKSLQGGGSKQKGPPKLLYIAPKATGSG